MNAKIKRVAGTVVVFGAALAECSGGGGNSATSDAALATKPGVIQAGDQWDYNVSGQGVDLRKRGCNL